MDDLLELCADLPEEHLAAGEVLIAEGSSPGGMFVLVSGTVLIERDGTAFAQIDFPGAIFGEMSWVLDQPATATARAAGDVVVHRISDPTTFMRERPDAAVSILRMTAARLDGLTQYLVDVKRQFAGNDDHSGMIGRIVDSLVHHQAPRPRTGSVRDPEGDHEAH
ncbi:MAG: cyclic nucleotide-binding domain-containing protein [Dermatophilaceae bacterium]